ncbi:MULTISPECIES: BON domain-containing protein [Gammaproteobacteria]|uniref:BON domain-containing protein n=1 Tax=Gammaproteobacteria TaxID=1236 RepID=UPI000DD05C3F|nr:MULTISPECIES: BON domain-containing protein [Gammaproteobacteria]RTE86330.1 BON domain-containing protein [Aliidiomarina sp. B3213]TCZ91680.1 BON domain-containing protein [Lysobacter sp. N42]
MNIFRLALALTFLALLSGCAAVVVGGAVATTSVVLDTRDVGTQIEDSGMRLRLSSLVNSNETLAEQRIRIVPFNGDVLLVGQVASESMKRQAEQLVRDSNEAMNVFNQLTVGEISSLADRSQDTWITTKVKTLLLRAPEYDTAGIKVVTENNEVYLLGLVDEPTAAHAVEVARNVRGVTRVVDVLFRETTN